MRAPRKERGAASHVLQLMLLMSVRRQITSIPIVVVVVVKRIAVTAVIVIVTKVPARPVAVSAVVTRMPANPFFAIELAAWCRTDQGLSA